MIAELIKFCYLSQRKLLRESGASKRQPQSFSHRRKEITGKLHSKKELISSRIYLKDIIAKRHQRNILNMPLDMT